MKKNVQGSTGDGPDDSGRTENYFDEIPQEEEPPWHARKTGRRKSKLKAKARNDSGSAMPNTPKDEFIDDSDLD